MIPLTSSIPLPGLARQLVVQEVLDKDLAAQAVQKARAEKISLVEWLIRSRLVSAKDVAYAASLEYGLSMVDLYEVSIPPFSGQPAQYGADEKAELDPLVSAWQEPDGWAC